MWGQGYDIDWKKPFDRIIPTRVGTSVPMSIQEPIIWDHPHACGDKCGFTAVGSASEGSSPRVWGQVIRLFENPAELRIIPTRVGTSGNSHLQRFKQ